MIQPIVKSARMMDLQLLMDMIPNVAHNMSLMVLAGIQINALPSTKMESGSTDVIIMFQACAF